MVVVICQTLYMVKGQDGGKKQGRLLYVHKTQSRVTLPYHEAVSIQRLSPASASYFAAGALRQTMLAYLLSIKNASMVDPERDIELYSSLEVGKSIEKQSIRRTANGV
jgi:hypothetical protein